MLRLQDFFHLPELDPLIEQLVHEPAGLILIAGLDPRVPASGASVPRADAPSASDDGFLPSGRNALFRILLHEMLVAFPSLTPTVVAPERESLHVPRQFSRRIKWALVHEPYTYAGRIASLARQRPDLLVIDQLSGAAVPAALEAARDGVRVLAQIDTIFRGGDVARQLRDLGATEAQLAGLRWVVAVGRMRTLCPHCKAPINYEPDQLPTLACQYPTTGLNGGAAEQASAPFVFYRSVGCAQCRETGRQGDVAVFDVFRADPDAANVFDQASVLPLQEYVLRLAMLGQLSLGDALHLDTDLLRRTYNMLTTSESALAEANAALRRKVLELETSNRVLQRQTEALISLQDIGQALIASNDLNDLAERVCRRARDLCGADRAILYLNRADHAQVLAVSGWDRDLVGVQVPARDLFGVGRSPTEPTPYNRLPPGIGNSPAQREVFRAGLRVPLIAQHEPVGVMVVHAAQKAAFGPGEVSLLRTFANQAALAIQRAGLFEDLWAKIAQLEAAQVELAQKERLERELELARQVQQSVLPRVFPSVPGYVFAALNEPARQVGGDFYDVFWVDEGRFGLVIADVSDKGMPAALYMGLTRSLILAEARREQSPRAVLANVNRLLLELGNSRMFVTVFYGVIDARARQLVYVRAGHERPLLLRDGEILSLGGQGTFLGVWEPESLRLSEEQIDLRPGDQLVLYTDGLTDVFTSEGQLFSLEHLKQFLQACVPCTPAALCERVFAHLADYRGSTDQFDDMTMLAMQVEKEHVAARID